MLRASAAEYCRRSRNSAIVGCRSTNRNAAAGTVSSPISRTPSDAWRVNEARSRRATAEASSGVNVIAIDIASSPWGSTKNV